MTVPPTGQGSRQGEEHGAFQSVPGLAQRNYPARTRTRPPRTFDQQTPQAGHPSRRWHNERHVRRLAGQRGEASGLSDRPQPTVLRGPPALPRTPARQRRTRGQEPTRSGQVARFPPVDGRTRKSDQARAGHRLVQADPTPTPEPPAHWASPKDTRWPEFGPARPSNPENDANDGGGHVTPTPTPTGSDTAALERTRGAHRPKPATALDISAEFCKQGITARRDG